MSGVCDWLQKMSDLSQNDHNSVTGCDVVFIALLYVSDHSEHIIVQVFQIYKPIKLCILYSTHPDISSSLCFLALVIMHSLVKEDKLETSIIQGTFQTLGYLTSITNSQVWSCEMLITLWEEVKRRLYCLPPWGGGEKKIIPQKSSNLINGEKIESQIFHFCWTN